MSILAQLNKNSDFSQITKRDGVTVKTGISTLSLVLLFILRKSLFIRQNPLKLTCRSAMKRKKALAALLNCEYRKRGRNVRTLYLAVLKKEGQREKQRVASEHPSTNLLSDAQ